MRNALHDVKYSFRSIRKSWAFALVIIGILSLGIGANTTVYSLVDGVVLNPFPFPNPDRLVGIGSEWPRLSRDLGFFETLSPREYLDVKEQSQTLEDVVMWDMGFRATAFGADQLDVLFTAFWFDNAFPTFEMPPALGRGFSREELEQGTAVAVVSHRYWQNSMGGDSAAIGATLRVEDAPYNVIGVMPERAQLYASDLWIPIGANADRFPRNRRQMQILARVKDGFTLDDVNTELAAISGRVEQEFAGQFDEYVGWRMRALTWTDVNVRQLKPAAFALLGAVGFVLLIVCANLASLLLARSASRRKEVVIRRALGASDGRILRQLLTESLLLSLAGGGVGVLLAVVVVPRLLTAIPIQAFFVLNATVSIRVLLFSAGVSVLAGILFGLTPALHGLKANLQGTLNAEGKSSTGARSRHRLQRVFVGAEFALALALLTQAGLLINSFVRLQNVDPGFDTSNTLTMRLTLPRNKYDEAGVRRFFTNLVDRVEQIPGVVEAGAGTQFPPITFSSGRFAPEGQQFTSDDELPSAYQTLVSDGYFETLDVPLRHGRTFLPADREGTPLVALVNEEAARRYFGGVDAIGQRFRVNSSSPDAPTVEIIGIIGSVQNRGPDVDPQPEIFANIRQVLGGWNQLYLLVRAERNAEQMLDAVTEQVAALDADQQVYAVSTVQNIFDTRTAPRRLGTLALTGFAMFAVALAAAGIYAVVSFGVGERTREIGVRIALGAPLASVRRLVVRQAMLPVAIGGVVGLAAAVAGGRAAAGFLFNVSGTDPITIGSVALLLGLAAVFASYLPARRASRLDPTVALRND